jgi:hypothetical protein
MEVIYSTSFLTLCFAFHIVWVWTALGGLWLTPRRAFCHMFYISHALGFVEFELLESVESGLIKSLTPCLFDLTRLQGNTRWGGCGLLNTRFCYRGFGMFAIFTNVLGYTVICTANKDPVVCLSTSHPSAGQLLCYWCLASPTKRTFCSPYWMGGSDRYTDYPEHDDV